MGGSRVATMVFAAPTGRSDAAAMLSRWYGLSDEQAQAVAVGGGPQQLAEGLAAYRGAGADTLIVVPVGDFLVTYEILGRARELLR